MESVINFRESPPVTNAQLNRLFAAPRDSQGILKHSLVYICAYQSGQLLGFVNVAWDGGIHAFILDPTVHPDFRRRGIGTELLLRATKAARERGMHWLHVDYEPYLKPFYERCGFRHTEAGLIRLDTTELN